MSGGQWAEPVDVGVEAVPTTWFTNVADDLRSLHKGGGQLSVSTISSGSDYVLDIGTTENVFNVDVDNSYNYTINYITTTGRQVGNEITLILTSTSGGSIGNGTASPPVGSASIKFWGTTSAINTTESSGGRKLVIRLVYDGSCWRGNSPV